MRSTKRFLPCLLAAAMVMTSISPAAVMADPKPAAAEESVENSDIGGGNSENNLNISEDTSGGAGDSTAAGAAAPASEGESQDTSNSNSADISDTGADSGSENKSSENIETEIITQENNTASAGTDTQVSIAASEEETLTKDAQMEGEGDGAEEEDTSAAVTITDENLRKAIAGNLGLEYTEGMTITGNMMASLTEFTAENAGITDLTGLYEAVNLKKLDLSGNRLFSDEIRGNKNNVNKAFEPFSVFTKLEELDLSGCAIGDNVIHSNVTTPAGNVWEGGTPYSITSSVMMLPELKVLNLSGNELSDNVNLIAGMFPKLQKLDLSDNDLHEFTLHNYSRKFFPDLKVIDLSGNYYVWDEIGEDFYPLVEDGINILHENEKNPANIWAVVREASSGQMAQNQMPVILPGESDEVDLGTVYGDSIKLYIATYEGASSTKITILDQKFTASMHTIMYSYIKDEYFEVKGLADGENTLPVTVMYQNGQTKEYTFKVRAVSHAEQEETEEYVKIKDASVYKYLCGQLGKADEVGTYKITKADLASLGGSLSVPACTDISWLKYCTNITGFVPEKLSVNDPQDSYTEVPDLSGLTKLNTLTICSSALSKVPDLSGLTSVTTLTVLPTTDGEYPDVSPLSGLQKLMVYHAQGKLPGGMEKLANLQSISINSDSGEYLIDKTNLPSVFGEAKTKTNTNLSLTGSGTVIFGDMTGVTARGSNLSLHVGGDVVIKFAKPETMPFNRFTFNGTGSVTSDKLPDNMNQIPSVIWLKFNAWNGDELTFNDGFKDLDQIQNITFKNLNMTKIPEQLATWDSLKRLTLSGVPLTKMDTDLSGTNLTELNLYETKLASVPDASLLPESLTSLSCYAAFPLTKMEGDYSKLVNLATLDLSYCSLSEIPEAIGSLTGLQTLNLGNNYYSDVPAGLFDRLEKLKTVTVGSMIPLTYIGGMSINPSSYQLTEGTQAAAELTKLKDRGVTVNLTVALWPFSQLAQASLDGKDLYIDRNARVMEAEYPAGTQKASLDLRAVYDDSKITIGDKTVTGKGTFELDLHEGYNEIPVSVFNEFTDVRCTEQTTNYKLSIYVGEKSSLQTMETGRYYQVDSKILKHGKSGASMADLYIAHKAILRKRADGRYEFYLDSLKASWMNTLQIYGENGEKIMSDIVAEDKAADTFRARFIVDEVTVPFTLNLFVNPMGYAPDCDVYFDLTSMIDITDTMPEGDTADLTAAVSRANEISKQRDIYTKESRDTFDEALAKASAVLENKKSTQDEIDAAAKALNDAIDALIIDESKLADKTTLEEALTTAKALTKGKHTDTNWEALQEAIADAQEVYDDIYATTKEAESAAKYLKNAVKAFNSSGEASTLDPANLADGVYTVYVDMINASNPDQKSMSDGAVTKPVTLSVKDGKYSVTANFHGIYVTLGSTTMFGYMKSLSYWDGTEYKDVTVDVTYDIVDEFNDADSDGKADFLYPHQMTFPLVNKEKGDDEDGFVHVQVFVPIMESISAGSGTQQALMKIDWTSLKEGDEAANEAIKTEKAKNDLSQAVADAKNISNAAGTYTEASFNALKEAITAAEQLLKNPEASKTDLEAAMAKVEAAKNGLVKAGSGKGTSGTGSKGSGSGNAKTAASVQVGKTYTVDGQNYQVTKAASGSTVGTVTFTKAKNAKKITVPDTVKLADGKTYNVTAVGAKAFTAKKIRTVTVGANVSKLAKKAFAKSKAKKLILKTKSLKKASVKGSLKSSKVKKIQVKVGTRKVNKKYVKKYKKIFTKKNAGKKATVK